MLFGKYCMKSQRVRKGWADFSLGEELKMSIENVII